MALFLKVSNSLDSLAAEMVQNLAAANAGVFEPHYIVTQTEGMNNWLRLQIAHQQGIMANCRFLKPNELIHQLYFQLGGPFAEMLSASNLSWLLFHLLGTKEFITRFPAIADYYRHAGEEADTRRMSLAEKCAWLFDQYQIYRADMIRRWNQGDSTGDTDHSWQQYLWLKAKHLAGNKLPDKTMVGSWILEKMKDHAARSLLQQRLPRIQLFGLSIITAWHVEILHNLAGIIDVCFYFINPAPLVYWYDDRSEKQLAGWRAKGYKHAEGNTAGNPLLTNWGRVVQDSFALFFKQDAFLNAYEDVGIIPPVPDNLLHKLQHDIFNAATDSRNPITATDLSDGSLQINACYTIAREVEVLYNYLVHLVDQRKEQLSPRDIVVMVSDIDGYAPYIKAVFNNAPYRFRYVIADESFSKTDNIFTALQSILQLNEENFKAETVLQLLDSSLIRNRFELSDIVRIRQVVDAANIRFGLTGRKDDDTHLVSWEYGIKRIMYGICMSGEMVYDDGEDRFIPLDLLEGSETQELIRFCHFAELLIDAIRQRHTPRPVAGWVQYIEYLLHNLVLEPEEDTSEDYHTLMGFLSDYNLVQEYMTDEVSFEVFLHNFLQLLDNTTRAGLFANGGITFCSMVPMRSIPFPVVALLGLDYDKFPRREQPASFNLLTRQRQTGDRNIRDNDKHLFLETILSARNYLYISYRGMNARDNTSLPPSALVDELLDYIEAGTDSLPVRSRLVTRHPLQNFSHQYAAGQLNLYNYLNHNTRILQPVIQEDKPIATYDLEEIALDDLVRFFRNPIKVYYNKVLGIRYEDEQVLLNDTELFDLDNLQQWGLRNRLLIEHDSSELQKKLVMTGELPLKNMAPVTIDLAAQEVRPVRALYEACTQQASPTTASIVLPLGNSLLKGTLQHIFHGQLVLVSWSRNEVKYLVETYIRYLAGVAAGVLTGASFISGVKKEQYYPAARLSQDAAIRQLTTLLGIYAAGLRKMPAFYPDLDIRPGQMADLNLAKFSKLVKDKLEKSTAPYLKPEYEKGIFDTEEALAAYKAIAAVVIAPLENVFAGYFND